MVKGQRLPYIDFLDSDTVSLQAGQSGQSFNIHRKLLESKCRTISSAFRSGFEEQQKGVYTFQDTSAGTLARFIEWAYTGDYPAVIHPTLPVQQSTSGIKNAEVDVKEDEQEEEEHEEEEDMMTTVGSELTSENHFLLSHIHLYIFCSIYFIPDLKRLAFERLSACFQKLGKPQSLDSQLSVIAALRLSFRKLPSQDRLLSWLALYAAYCVKELRLQKDFLDLLSDSPALSLRMVLDLNPTSSAPWNTTLGLNFYEDDFD